MCEVCYMIAALLDEKDSRSKSVKKKLAFAALTAWAGITSALAATAPPNTTKSYTKDPVTSDKSRTKTYSTPQYNSVTKFSSSTYTALIPDCSIPIDPTLTSSSSFSQIPQNAQKETGRCEPCNRFGLEGFVKGRSD
ncbi:uncharacterized protein MEPE_01849 [Melanopsichium pennsylvanicum]|uniref:Uncharacterized protein n=1 Tax=Melanopsichium pennsylvanicum TaxID=63383 RepID=A0AAJ5C431_9BASI|nr:uncharacterized protein MEPE_01849 [Melanopsichium pennsylvanicum]